MKNTSKKWLEDRLPMFTALLYILVATIGALNGGLWGVVGIGGVIPLFLLVARLDRRLPWPSKDMAAMALLALGVMAALTMHSVQPTLSWREWLRLTTIFLPLILFSSPAIQARATPPYLLTVLSMATATGIFMLGVELFLKAPLLHWVQGAGASLTQYNRGLSYLVILSLPVMASLWLSGQRAAMFGFVVLLLIPASLTESRAAKLALVLGIMTILSAHLWPLVTRRMLATLTVLLSGWPFAVQKIFITHPAWLQHLPDSWRARMEIWDYMSYRIMERPLLGWGLGTSHTLPFYEPHGASYVFIKEAAPHPHNVVVQLWVELGLPGLALGIIFALLILRKASRLDVRLAPFAMGAWVAALALCLTAYNFWTDASFAAFALTGFVFAELERALPKNGVPL